MGSAWFPSLLAAAFVASFSTHAAAYHDEAHGLLDYTAHSLNGGELRLGLLEQNVGVHRRVQLGTETLPWVAGLFLRTVMPNLNVKLGLLRTRRFDLSLRGAAFYASLNARDAEGGGRGDLFIGSAALYTSTRLSHVFSLHTETTLAWLSAGANVDAGALSVQGSGVGNSLQLGAMLETRLSELLAITLRARLQPYSSAPVIRSHSRSGEATQLDVDARISTHGLVVPAALIAGLAVSWKHVNLQFGMGYGTYFVPSLGVPIPGTRLVPDGSLFVRF